MTVKQLEARVAALEARLAAIERIPEMRVKLAHYRPRTATPSPADRNQ